MRYEYKVVPAPAKGARARGIKGPEGRFAFALEQLFNDMGSEDWEFQRAETLPSEERQGLTGSVTVWRNVLVFRRPKREVAAEPLRMLESPDRASPVAGLGAAGIVADKPAATIRADEGAPAPEAEPDEPNSQPETSQGGAPHLDIETDDAEEAAADSSPKTVMLADGEHHDNGVEETQDLDKPITFLAARAKRKARGKD